MKRSSSILAILVALTAAYVAVYHVAGPRFPTPVAAKPGSFQHIRMCRASEQLLSLFDGLTPSHRGSHSAVLRAGLLQPCPAKPGLLAKAAAALGVEVTAHVETSCIDNAGLCKGCPTRMVRAESSSNMVFAPGCAGVEMLIHRSGTTMPAQTKALNSQV